MPTYSVHYAAARVAEARRKLLHEEGFLTKMTTVPVPHLVSIPKSRFLKMPGKPDELDVTMVHKAVLADVEDGDRIIAAMMEVLGTWRFGIIHSDASIVISDYKLKTIDEIKEDPMDGYHLFNSLMDYLVQRGLQHIRVIVAVPDPEAEFKRIKRDAKVNHLFLLACEHMARQGQVHLSFKAWKQREVEAKRMSPEDARAKQTVTYTRNLLTQRNIHAALHLGIGLKLSPSYGFDAEVDQVNEYRLINLTKEVAATLAGYGEHLEGECENILQALGKLIGSGVVTTSAHGILQSLIDKRFQ